MKGSKIFHAFYNRLRCINPTYSLAICWIAGLLLGTAYGNRADQASILLMRVAASCHMSIVGLFLILCFPLLFSAFAVYIHRPHWLVVISFFKAFLFASCSAILGTVFSTAGWLVRALLQFSDICTLPLFYWFCTRNIAGQKATTWIDLLICLAAITVLGIFDFCVISPFLVKLIDI